jgi:autotransporter-associated beta strand protein
VDFQPGTGRIELGTLTLVNSLIGGWALLNGTSFAGTLTGGTVAAATMTPLNVTSVGAGTTNYSLTGGSTSTGALAMNALQLTSVSGGTTFTLGGGLTLTSGGLLFNNSAGAMTIAGSHVGSGAAESIFILNGTTPANALTVSSSIAAGSLTLGGTGLLVLSGTSLFTGSVTVNSGTLRLSGAGARLGVPAAGTGTVIRQGGVLDVNAAGSNQLLYTGGPTQPLIVLGPLTGSGLLDNTSATAAAVSIGTTASTAAGVFTGIISNSGGGSLSLVRNGASGIVYLTGSNTYTGPTILSGGAVLGVTNLANGGVASGIGASSSESANLVFNGGTLLYTGGNASFTQLTQTPSVSTDRLFTLAGNGSIDSSGNYGNAASFALNQNNAALVFANTGTVGFAGTGVRTLTLTGNSTGDNEIKLQLVNNGASALSVSKGSTGLWLLSGSNTYTGATTIAGGVLQAQDGVGLPTTSNLTLNGGVFQSSGIFSRPIGTTAGSIQFTGNGGFAASSSKLTVNLLGSATLGAAPMANSTLILNSTTALADVEFASPLSLGTAARTVQVDDNANTTFDFATISGTLSGAAAS